MGLASPTTGYQPLASCSRLSELPRAQQNCLPGVAAPGFLPFPVPTQPNTAGLTIPSHQHWGSRFLLPHQR